MSFIGKAQSSSCRRLAATQPRDRRVNSSRFGTDAGGSPRCARAVATPLVNDGDIATYTTLTRHTLRRGQAVVIADADDHASTDGSGVYNGPFEIVSIPSANQFQVKLSGTPSVRGAPSALAYSLWQVERFIVDRNLIEQILHPLKSSLTFTSTEGFDFNGSHAGWLKNPPLINPAIFPLVILRRNFIDKVDRKTDVAGVVRRALILQTCGTSIVERNISGVDYIDGDVLQPVTLFFEHCGAIRALTNGKALQVFDKSLLGPLGISGIPRKNQFLNNLITDAELGGV